MRGREIGHGQDAGGSLRHPGRCAPVQRAPSDRPARRGARRRGRNPRPDRRPRTSPDRTSALGLPWIAWVAAFAAQRGPGRARPAAAGLALVLADRPGARRRPLPARARRADHRPGRRRRAGPGAAPPPVRPEARLQPRAVRARRLPGHDRLRRPRRATRRCRAPGTGWPRWPRSPSRTLTACACIFAVMRVSEAVADASRELPRMLGAVAALRPRRRGGRPARRRHRRAEPGVAGPAGPAVRSAHRRLPRLRQGPRAAEQPPAAARDHLAALQQRRRPHRADRLPDRGARRLPRRARPSWCSSARATPPRR